VADYVAIRAFAMGGFGLQGQPHFYPLPQNTIVELLNLIQNHPATPRRPLVRISMVELLFSLEAFNVERDIPLVLALAAHKISGFIQRGDHS
jgi:hypothetical protein